MTRRTQLNILVVSNLWPPHFIGGYELGARQVASRLEHRGHRVTVLTSTYGERRPCCEGNVHRLLFEQFPWQPMNLRQLLVSSIRSCLRVPRVRRFLRSVSFDIVYLFSPVGLNSALLEELRDTGRPVVAYISDDWPSKWPFCDGLFAKWMQLRPWPWIGYNLTLGLARQVLRHAGVLARHPQVLQLRHAQFVSRYIHRISAGRMPLLASQEIIPWGVNLARYPFRERAPEEIQNWIFVGQVQEHKGVHTAIDAVALLRSQGQPVTLTIYGDDETEFSRLLKERTEAENLVPYVRFAGRRPAERLWREAYNPSGLLILPSIWDEPFSMTLIEAFASGIPVLTTLTGGTGEIVRPGETATVFTAGDPQHLAAQYCVLNRAPESARAMARRARRIVEQHLDIEVMVNRIESHLIQISEGQRTGGCEPFQPRAHPWEPTDTAIEPPNVDRQT